MDYVQTCAKILSMEILGQKAGRRLAVQVTDGSAPMELVWFQGISWIQKMLEVGSSYRIFGKVSFFKNIPQISHPEIEQIFESLSPKSLGLEPVYSTTEKLRSRNLSGRQIARLTEGLFQLISPGDIPENLPNQLLGKYHLLDRYQAFRQVHFPESVARYEEALRRLKFEELFISQIRLGMLRHKRHASSRGWVFEKVGPLFNSFFYHSLPFELTGAQKRVIREIRKDLGSGRQMNRLLQGDVGSGKTMVALMSMLIAADNGFQSCLMAPTEILARQHAESLASLLKDLPVQVRILTGSSPAREKKEILESVAAGETQILIGTHAVIEDTVQFKNLGFAIIDEQHRFGVAQRAKLWKKNQVSPHILVMTATPIPRTLALTCFGELDYSIMDELPPGRKPVRTVHRTEYSRPSVMDFMRGEIFKGRQVYVIYPLIEESAKVDYENLMKGYEEVKAFFPEPQYQISMVHGRQKPAMKQANMDRFIKGESQILVSTTVIEVGVNVANASVMVIESAEKFGLPQLHQLRGRVGRGSDQSYCILLTRVGLSRDAKKRIRIFCSTNDGFKIAEKDLEMRGPGDIEGTRQSGMLDLKVADIVKDTRIFEVARAEAMDILETDPELSAEDHGVLRQYLARQKGKTPWSRIS